MSIVKKAALGVATVTVAISGYVVVPASGSPGGLDSHGGHHCWTSCASYGLKKGDYHCHQATKECRRANRRHANHGH